VTSAAAASSPAGPAIFTIDAIFIAPTLVPAPARANEGS